MYNGTAVFTFADRQQEDHGYSIKVPEQEKWTLTNQSVKDNISVGESTRLGSITIDNTGNTGVDMSVSTTGNLSSYISMDRAVQSFPGVDEDVVFTVRAPRDTPFGLYTANATVSSDSAEEWFELRTRFVDTIAPSVDGTAIRNFMATKPDQFTVQASDNLAVERVNATVLYTDTVQEGNDTVLVNKTLEHFEFEREANTDLWTVTMENADRIGSYFVTGAAWDASNNTDNFTEAFDIRPLDVVTVPENFKIDRQRVDSELSTQLGSIESSTPVSVTLKHFDQPLERENETWKLGVEVDGKKYYFSGVNGTIELDDAGPVSLLVYGEEAELYDGRLSWSPIEQHVDLPVTQFNGRMVDFSIPEDETMELFDQRYWCDASQSASPDRAGWNCTTFIPATSVEPSESLEDTVRVAVPSEAKRQIEDSYDGRIDDLLSSLLTWKIIALFGFLFGLSGFGFGFLTHRIIPETYGVRRKSTN